MDATKRPWRIDSREDRSLIGILGPDDLEFDPNPVAAVNLNRPESYANARLIVKAVNLHDEMVGALEFSLNELSEAKRLAASHPSPCYVPTGMVIAELKALLKRAMEE